MLILGLESPGGKVTYMGAAFPSACGKTNLAMMVSALESQGYRVWTVGDDIAWMKIGEDGYLHAINPEAGFFGVAPGTGMKTNQNVMGALRKNTLFTNVAMTSDREPWWEGIGSEAPAGLINWKGEAGDPAKGADGKFLWPGYGENVRVLKWILERVEGRGTAQETPIGYVPAKNGLTREGLKISDEALNELLHVNPEDWEAEMEDSKQFLSKFGARLPRQIGEEHEKLARRFQRVVSA